MKLFSNKTAQTALGYLFFIALVIIVGVAIFGHNGGFGDFLTSIENRTFDLRQSVLVSSKYKKPSKDIVLITIDDASYEYLLDKYGEWPIPRGVYADVINYLEKQNPKAIAFDLMFVKSMKSKSSDDKALSEAITSNKNVYTSINFDNQSFDVRTPIKLPESLTVKVDNESKSDFSKELTFVNCRPILTQILEGTPNVGLINVSRADDGILRRVPPLMSYQDKFYPHLSLLVGLKGLGDKYSNYKDFFINKKSEIKIGDKTIPLDKTGSVILNWYGPSGETFKEIPLYKIVKAINEGKEYKDFNFKNKIIYVGTTAVSLYDTKSVPIDKLYPGVEIHATFVNNLINNEFIKKVDVSVDFAISIILAAFIGIIVFKTRSTFVSITSTLLTIFGYIVFAYYVMKFFNLWIGIVIPVSVVLLVFISMYILKYILKSRDFEYQYKLATTDGLTELYNHRYFQEQMISQVANCERYNSSFSLILIDIDYFKKFNDMFGHQSGDAVLKQVAIKLKKNVRSSDFVCRYGGEEMAIILPNTDKDEAIITAEKICQVIAEKPFKLANNQESNVTISLGVATFPQDGEDSSSIIAKADERLYFAKENGRNQVGS